MLTFEDCLGLCDLTEDEIDAIAEHENISELAALELAEYLCQQEDGALRVRRMIVEDIEAAQKRGDHRHSAKLKHVLQHFVATHSQRLGVAT